MGTSHLEDAHTRVTLSGNNVPGITVSLYASPGHFIFHMGEEVTVSDFWNDGLSHLKVEQLVFAKFLVEGFATDSK